MTGFYCISKQEYNTVIQYKQNRYWKTNLINVYTYNFRINPIIYRDWEKKNKETNWLYFLFFLLFNFFTTMFHQVFPNLEKTTKHTDNFVDGSLSLVERRHDFKYVRIRFLALSPNSGN